MTSEVQVEDSGSPYNRLQSPPVFVSKKSDLESSDSTKALGRVYYEDDDETQPLLSSHSSSSLSNKDVKEGLLGKSEVEITEKKSCCDKRWRSIYTMYFTMFVMSLTFSIIISSVWPYLRQVDYKYASAEFLGWVVAAYSFGQLISSPLMGLWADRRPLREPLAVTVIISVIFNIFYSYCGAFPPGVAAWMLIVARFMIGTGAGIGAVARSYVSEVTTLEERTGAMGSIGACQAFGFIVGPALGLAFVPLGSKGVSIDAIKFHLNMFTGPTYLNALLSVLNLLFLILFFRDCREKTRKTKIQTAMLTRERGQIQEESDSIIPPPNAPKRKRFDVLAAIASIILFFVILCCFSVFETLLSPLTMDEYAWNKKQTVLYNNLFFAALSILSMTTFFSMRFITKKVEERVVLMISMFMMAFAFFAMIPMTGDPPRTVTMSSLTLADHPNATKVPLISLVNANETFESLGCRDPPQSWCTVVPRIYLAQLIVAMIVVTPAYAASSVLTFIIYSKVLGPFPQGVMMGVLTAAGSLARGLGPMGIGALYQFSGPAITFAAIVGMIGATIVLLLICSPRLVPYQRYCDSRKTLVVLQS